MIYVNGSLKAKVRSKAKQSYLKYLRFNKAKIEQFTFSTQLWPLVCIKSFDQQNTDVMTPTFDARTANVICKHLFREDGLSLPEVDFSKSKQL